MLKSLKIRSLQIPAMATAFALTAGTALAADTNQQALHSTAAPIQLAASTQSSETSFEEKKAEAEKTFESWVDQLSKHAEKADDKAEDVADDAGDALNDAWAEVQSTWEEVKEASEENWEEAKAKFDDSVDRLEAAWNELQGG